MERLNRKPFQGVTNIIRFNWQFYVFAFIALAALVFSKQFLSVQLNIALDILIVLSALAIIISLATSYYIYDLSNLYSLNWLNKLQIAPFTQLVNINAGFDETSALIEQKYPHSTLLVFDFYDPTKHTEVSIERARKAYPPFTGTQTINTNAIPLKENSTDHIFLILAAHEIRNVEERILFFKQLQKSLTSTGKIIVVEHLQDLPNFIAYNFGFFHFHSKKTWLKAFEQSNLTLEKEIKITHFISTFILVKMELHLKIVGYMSILLAFVHVIFPKQFNWKKEMPAISLINQQLMYVHTFFIAFVVLLMGILCISCANDLLTTPLGNQIILGLFLFWGLRLIFQFFIYSSKLWKGKRFETIIHIFFSLIWIYFTAVFCCIYFKINF